MDPNDRYKPVPRLTGLIVLGFMAAMVGIGVDLVIAVAMGGTIPDQLPLWQNLALASPGILGILFGIFCLWLSIKRIKPDGDN